MKKLMTAAMALLVILGVILGAEARMLETLPLDAPSAEYVGGAYHENLGLCTSGEGMCLERHTLDRGTPVVLSVTRLEAAILDQANKCELGNPNKRLPESTLLDLLRMEEAVGLPDTLRGLVLAAGCAESGLQAAAEGDHEFGRKGRPMAIGFMQMWKWWEKAYNIDRRDPYQAVPAYLAYMEEQVGEAERWCKVKGERAWIVGLARASRGSIGKGYKRQLRKLPYQVKEYIADRYGVEVDDPGLKSSVAVRVGRKELPLKAIRYAERCYDETGHIKRLRRWRRRWAPTLVAMNP